jgi:hypothetical protein
VSCGTSIGLLVSLFFYDFLTGLSELFPCPDGPFGGRSSDYKFPIFKPGGKDREWWKVIGYRLLGIITTGKRVAFFGLRVSGKVQTSSEIQGFKIVWDVDAERA